MLSREESCAQREKENGELQSVVWYEELQIGKSRGIRGHWHRLLQKGENRDGFHLRMYHVTRSIMVKMCVALGGRSTRIWENSERGI